MLGNILLFYILIVIPTKIIVFGYLEVKASNDFVTCFVNYYRKYSNTDSETPFTIQVIEDAGYCAVVFRDVRNTRYIFSSKLVNDWNEIDIESTVLYLLEVQRNTYLLRDTCILVLATIAERFIITSFIGAALVHHFHSSHRDLEFDRFAVHKMQFVQGYVNMLTKYKEGASLVSNLHAALGMSGIGDIVKKGLNHTMFAVHETLEARIDALRQD